MPDEQGRRVSDAGQIIYDWPPAGRFKELWDRLISITTQDERLELRSLIGREVDRASTLVAYTDESGEWIDCEPDWSVVEDWRSQ